MARFVLAVDIDSCIYNPQPLYSQAAEHLFGEGYLPEEVVHYYWLRDRYGPNFWDIFNVALHPDWIPRREIYPNCVETLTSLRDDFKIGIHFITHNVKPKLMRKPLEDWLGDNFGDVGLSITSTGKKIPIMKRVGAFGIIEDKYDTLLEARRAGLYGCGVIQPHNRKDLKNDDFDAFEDWYEGEDVLTDFVADYKIRSRRKRSLTHF